jgi:hypothetical protein
MAGEISMTGWLYPDLDEPLDVANEGEARVWSYLRTHRILVIAITNGASNQPESFLVCTGCVSLGLRTKLAIHNLKCARTEDDSLILTDDLPGIRIECTATRLFDEESFKTWLGNDAWLLNATGDQEVDKVRSSLE